MKFLLLLVTLALIQPPAYAAEAGNDLAYETPQVAPNYLKGIYGSFGVSVHNTGATTWGPGHRLRLLDGNGAVVSEVTLAISGALPPGSGVGASFSFFLPAVAGTYHYTIQAEEAGAGPFGPAVAVDLVVIDHFDTENSVRFDRYFGSRASDHFEVSVSVTNTGTRNWQEGDRLVLLDAAGRALASSPLANTASGYGRVGMFSLPLARAEGVHRYTVRAQTTGLGFFGEPYSISFTVASRPELDFNGDTSRDLIWHNAGSGDLALWQMYRAGIGASVVYTPGAGWTVAAAKDFDGDGKTDLLWRNAVSGGVVLWRMNGTAPAATDWLYNGDTSWAPVQSADFNGDGRADLLWFNSATGNYAIWLMDGATLIGSTAFAVAGEWTIAAAKDFDGDGKTDLLWRNTATGGVVLWQIDGLIVSASTWVYDGGTAWAPVAFGDFDADTCTDILWSNATTGQQCLWLMNGASVAGSALWQLGLDWTAIATKDFDGDVKSDLLWRNTVTGALVLWRMDGIAVTDSAWLYNGGTVWRPVVCDDFDADHRADILWFNAAEQQYALWLMHGSQLFASEGFPAPAGWEL